MPFCDHERLIDRLIDDFGPLAGKRVLELGAEDCTFGAKLAQRGADIQIVVDGDRQMSACAQDRSLLDLPGVAVVRHDPEAWIAKTAARYDLTVTHDRLALGGGAGTTLGQMLSHSNAVLATRRGGHRQPFQVEEAQHGYDRPSDRGEDRAMRDFVVDRGFRIIPLEPGGLVADGAILCLRLAPSL